MTSEIKFPREMSEEDALFWNMESDPTMRSTVTAVTLLDAAPDRELLRARLQQAVVDIPRLRQRVVELPLFVSRPVWVRDPDFDLDYHLRWLGAPRDGSLESLFELSATLSMSAFDRARPLWEFTVVEGLEDGRAALVQKLHHAVTDGVGGTLLMDRVYDRGPERAPPPIDSLVLYDEHEPGLLGLTAEAVWRHARERPRVARRRIEDALRVARHPIRFAGRAVSDAIELVPTLVPDLEPMSPIARDRSSRQRHHGFIVDLETLKQAARVHHCKVNDAFVTALSGGWHRYHQLHGARVAELRVAVPISLRRGRRASVSGNQVALARVTVPVDEPDAGSRMIETRTQLRRELARPNERVMQWTASLGNRAPEVFRRRIARLFTRGIDVVASCVPGFPMALYMAGTRVRGFYMFGPTGGTALNATLFSYEGRAGIAMSVDPSAVPDGGVMRHCMVEGFDEVLKLAV